MASTDKEPQRSSYRSERAWRIAKRRYLRKRQRQTEQYRTKLNELRNAGVIPPSSNSPQQNRAPRVETVPWAG